MTLDDYLYLQNVHRSQVFFSGSVTLTGTEYKLVHYPLKGLFARPCILVQDVTKVTCHPVFNMQPLVSSDFCTILYDLQNP